MEGSLVVGGPYGGSSVNAGVPAVQTKHSAMPGMPLPLGAGSAAWQGTATRAARTARLAAAWARTTWVAAAALWELAMHWPAWPRAGSAIVILHDVLIPRSGSVRRQKALM